MPEQSRKRKAPEQLSPYSQDPADIPSGNTEETAGEEPVRAFRKARARRTLPAERPALKGIFGNVSLAPEPAKRASLRDTMMAGLNKSLLSSISLVLRKQANRDLRFLFEQYRKYVKDIEENSN